MGQGIATHTGLPVLWVRLVLVLVGIFGPGLVAYLFLWTLAPSSRAAADQTLNPRRAAAADEQRGVRWILIVGLVAIVGGGGTLTVGIGFAGGWGDSLLTPLAIIAVGAVIAYARIDSSTTANSRTSLALMATVTIGQAMGGTVLIAIGIYALVEPQLPISQLRQVLLASVAIVVGMGVVSAPWVVRGFRRMQSAQQATAMADARADVAAHLHDSVLQTLALIQREGTDAATARRLARAQERELRAWLYSKPSEHASSIAARAAAIVYELEDAHSVSIELVTTGDAPASSALDPLLAALREALSNAIRHGAAPVSVYVEITGTRIEAFVRDHGTGFDPKSVPEDRMGVRTSIIGRMKRHGGRATIKRLDCGTEVSLEFPLPKEES